MAKKSVDIEDLFDLTETSISESSSNESNSTPFVKHHHPFILELHNLEKDDPTYKSALSHGKIKKHKKKRKAIDTNKTEMSSSSNSETSLPAGPINVNKEEFYDAHGSYHAIPDNQISNASAPAMPGALVLARTTNDPKITASSVAQDKSSRSAGEFPQRTDEQTCLLIDNKPASPPP